MGCMARQGMQCSPPNSTMSQLPEASAASSSAGDSGGDRGALGRSRRRRGARCPGNGHHATGGERRADEEGEGEGCHAHRESPWRHHSTRLKR